MCVSGGRDGRRNVCVRASGSGSRGQWHGASDWGRRRGATAHTAHTADTARGLAAWLLGFPRFHTGSSSLAGPGSAGVMQGTLCTDRADLCPISSLSHGAASSSSRACFHLSRDGYCAGRLTSLHCHSLLTAPAGPAATAAAADGRPPAQPAEACPPVRQSATRQPRLLHVAACCCCGCRPPPLLCPPSLSEQRTTRPVTRHGSAGHVPAWFFPLFTWSPLWFGQGGRLPPAAAY